MTPKTFPINTKELIANEAERIVIIRKLWETMNTDITAWDHKESRLTINKTTRDLREYLYHVFYPFTEASNPNNLNDQYDSLCLWYRLYKRYKHFHMPTSDRQVNDRLFHLINEDFPTVQKRWLTPTELAEEYGFSTSWQSKARMSSSSSTIPFSKIGGKMIRYDRHEIDKWLEEHQVQGN